MSKTLVMPVELRVIRYYRTYVRVPEGSTDYEIVEELKKHDLDEELTDTALDPGMEIEADDICSVYLDHEGEWIEED